MPCDRGNQGPGLTAWARAELALLTEPVGAQGQVGAAHRAPRRRQRFLEDPKPSCLTRPRRDEAPGSHQLVCDAAGTPPAPGARSCPHSARTARWVGTHGQKLQDPPGSTLGRKPGEWHGRGAGGQASAPSVPRPQLHSGFDSCWLLPAPSAVQRPPCPLGDAGHRGFTSLTECDGRRRDGKARGTRAAITPSRRRNLRDALPAAGAWPLSPTPPPGVCALPGDRQSPLTVCESPHGCPGAEAGAEAGWAACDCS